MWDWLWGLAQALASTPSAPPAVTETVECQPGYTYSEWEMTSAANRYEGTWVVEYRHYQRTRTDDCTGETKTESKVEGPFQLWPAVPHGYTESVSRPTGGTDVSGTPLRSSNPIGVGDSVQVGPVNGEGASPKEPGTTPAGPVDVTAFLLLAGAMAFAVVTRRFGGFMGGATAQGEPVKAGDPKTDLHVDPATQGFEEREGAVPVVSMGGATRDPGLVEGDSAAPAEAVNALAEPVVALGGATRDPGLVEGDSAASGAAVKALAEPVVELGGVSRSAGDPSEMSNNNENDQGLAGSNPVLICTPVRLSPAEALAQRIARKVDRFLELTTGRGADEWANYRELGWGDKIRMFSDGFATVASFGGTALIRRAFETKAGDVVLEFLTGGTSEQWQNFGKQSLGQKAWMIGSTALTIGTFLLPPLALGKLAPVLKGAGGLGGRIVATVAKSGAAQRLAAWGSRVAASKGGQAVASGARWVAGTKAYRAVAGAVGNGVHASGMYLRSGIDKAVKSGLYLTQFEVVQKAITYGRTALKWVSDKGFRSLTAYTKLDLRNPVLAKIGGSLSNRFNTGHNLTGAFKAIFTESRAFKWFAGTRLGQIYRDTGLTVWHWVELLLKRDLAKIAEGAGKMTVGGTDNWLKTKAGHLSEQAAKQAAQRASGRRASEARRAIEGLRERYEYLRNPLKGIRERQAIQDLSNKAQKVRDLFAEPVPKEPAGH